MDCGVAVCPLPVPIRQSDQPAAPMARSVSSFSAGLTRSAPSGITSTATSVAPTPSPSSSASSSDPVVPSDSAESDLARPHPRSQPQADSPNPFEADHVVRVNSLSDLRELSKVPQDSADGGPVAYDITPMPIEDVIELVATLLSSLTATNDFPDDPIAAETSLVDRLKKNTDLIKSSVLSFHGKTVPAIGILPYMLRIQKYCPSTTQVFIGLLVYFDRMAGRLNCSEWLASRPASPTIGPAKSDSPADVATRSPSSPSCPSCIPPDAQNTPPLSDSTEPDPAVIADSAAVPPCSSPPSPSDQVADRAADRAVPNAATEPVIDVKDREADQTDRPVKTPKTDSDIPPVDIHFILNSYNIHRLIIAGVTCASKFFSDIFFTNYRYAKVGGLSLRELNRLEIQFLLLNDFRLFISMPQILHYSTILAEFYIRKVAPEPSSSGEIDS